MFSILNKLFISGIIFCTCTFFIEYLDLLLHILLYHVLQLVLQKQNLLKETLLPRILPSQLIFYPQYFILKLLFYLLCRHYFMGLKILYFVNQGFLFRAHFLFVANQAIENVSRYYFLLALFGGLVLLLFLLELLQDVVLAVCFLIFGLRSGFLGFRSFLGWCLGLLNYRFYVLFHERRELQVDFLFNVELFNLILGIGVMGAV